MFCRLYRNSSCQYRVLAAHLVSKQQMCTSQTITLPVISVLSHDLSLTLPCRTQCSHFSIMMNETSVQRCKDEEHSRKSNQANPVEIKEIQQIFECTEVDAVKLHEYFSASQDDAAINLGTINKTVKWLIRIGASMPIIIGNCHILLIPIGKILEYFMISTPIFMSFIFVGLQKTA